MTTGRTVEEWAEVRNAAHEALKWARGTLIQLNRWREAFHLAHLGADINWDAFDQADVETHLLAVTGDQLRTTLAGGPHADLLPMLPPPNHINSELPGATSDGALYLRHVRNAHEHNDQQGWFSRDYGFTHKASVASADGSYGTVGGIQLPGFEDAVRAIARELEPRLAEANHNFGVLLARRLASESESEQHPDPT